MVAATGLLLSLLILFGCGEPSLFLSLDAWPQGGSAGARNDNAGWQYGHCGEIAAPQTRFIVRLPTDAAGTVAMTIDGWMRATVSWPQEAPWKYRFQAGCAAFRKHGITDGTRDASVPEPDPRRVPQQLQYRGLVLEQSLCQQNMVGDIWAAGLMTCGPLARGTILHWDGKTWSAVPSPTKTCC